MTRLALFDLDHTLIPADSDHEWGRYMVKLGIVDPETYAHDVEKYFEDYKAGCLDIRAYLRFALAPLARHSRAQLDAWHRDFMAEVITPLIKPQALALVAEHRQRGDLCCVITATNSFVTRPIAAAFGVENLIGCEPATVDGKPDSQFNGELDGEPSFQEGKIIRCEAWLASLGKGWQDFEESYFYSDSRNDIPLLEKVSEPVATNPDETLCAHARAKHWRILELFN